MSTNERQKKWYAGHAEQERPKKAALMRKYRAENPDKHRALGREFRQRQRAKLFEIYGSVCLRPMPTPNAGGEKWGGTWQELGGAGNWLRNTTEGSAQIHPEEYEWMMGWPIGWSALEPLAEAKFQQWLDAHGSYSHE